MKDVFQLTAPEGVQLLLRSFGAEERRLGHALFGRGCVQELRESIPGSAFSGLVHEARAFSAALQYDPAQGKWEGQCSCGADRCGHIFALASAVLAEYRAAEVQRLSACLASKLQGTGVPPAGLQSGLEQHLRAALGRPLHRREAAYVKRIHGLYVKCRPRRRITGWELYEIGVTFDGVWSEPANLWPAFPDTELEFWLFIAHAMEKTGQMVPDFMRPALDFSLIEDKLRNWQRLKQIQEWKSALGNEQEEVATSGSMPVQEVDLRIALKNENFNLQWRAATAPDYVECTETQYRRFTAGQDILFTTEAELIWGFFQDLYAPRAAFRYLEPDSRHALWRLLRLPFLNRHFVDEAGQPLARVPEPLRWVLVPAASEQDDYRLRLAQADGSEPPNFLLRLGHAPTLYLTASAVFTGPEAPRFFGDDLEVVIPAPALETSAGVSILHALGIELPPRVRDRVRVLPYDVRIVCQLEQPEFGPEECQFDIQAEAADGSRKFWNGFAWQQHRRKPSAQPNSITVYDKANLAVFPAVLDSLNIKPNYHQKLATRVTRKFPETFVEWLKSLPPHISVELKGELASFLSGDVAGSLKLDVTEAEIDWFDLRVVLNVADTSLSPEEIKLLLNAKGRYVRLEGKGWRRLKFNLDEEDNERLARLGLSPRELSAEPQRLHALQLADAAAKKFLPAEQLESVQRRAGEIRARVAPDLPQGITAQLRPYQLEGFHFLAYLASNRFGGILADDMGLGKTLQTLSWLLWLRLQPLPDGHPTGEGPWPPCLVVCPKSVMDNWHAEAARFTPGLRVRCWSARELPDFSAGLSRADLHVINYSQLRNIGEKLLPTRWLAVILDEGQYIKNPNSQTAQIARALRAGHRLILSGTPIENRLLDLWSLMSFAMPGVLGTKASFARLYDAKGDPFARRRLSARVRPFVLRRTKAQVAKDLPDRIEEDLFCEIEGEQQMLYRAELKRAQQLLLGINTQKELASQQFHFLTSLLRLRQICCHPRLMKPDSTSASAKTEALLEQIEPLMEEGHKVLVFSQFVELLDLLRPELEQRQWPVFYLAGHTENRGEIVAQFQGAPGPGIFLISLKAGGFGLNLTAANYVVLFDPWWNPAVENQAIDRAHRIGQTEKVIAYRLLIKNSIEEKIRELQRKKKALAEDVLGEEKFSQSLTLDDLRFLFAD